MNSNCRNKFTQRQTSQHQAPQQRAHALRPLRQKQAGLTLIEMMISLVLGLIIVSAVVNVYMGSTRSSRFTSGLSSMQENGRYGVSALQRGIRMAGYSPARRIAPFDFDVPQQDGIVVRMQQLTDCNGQSTAGTNGIAVNTYQFDAAERQIYCRGNSAAATNMPLVDGVDGFRVLYGIDADGDNFSEKYVPYDASLNPLTVNSVRFAMLISSNGPIRNRSYPESHILLDEEYTTNDKWSRRVFETTVLLRNRRPL